MPYTLRCYPHDDDAFAAAAATALRAFVATARHGEDGIPQGVADALRSIYPLVVVHRGDDLAVLRPDDTVLYVYRDGTPLAAGT